MTLGSSSFEYVGNHPTRMCHETEKQGRVTHRESAGLGGDAAENRVGGVPLQDGAILQAEDGPCAGTDDTILLCELGFDEAL